MENKYVFIIGLVCMICASCQDQLEENPKSFLSSTNFFNTEENFDSALRGQYTYFSSGPGGGLYDGNLLSYAEVFADYNTTPFASEQTPNIYVNAPASNYYASRFAWSVPYAMINNSNLILEKLETTDLGTAEKRLVAEAKFFRGYAYFILVQFFGDVPLRTQTVTDLKNLQIPRAPQSEVYKLIIQDLLDAEAGLPLNSPQEGRVNGYVAKALLARIYLTSAGNPMQLTANYTLAKKKADEVITSGVYALLDDYSKVFHNSAYTKESIWEVLSVGSGNSSNFMHRYSCPAPGYFPIMLPSKTFIKSFPDGDQRKAWGIITNYQTPTGEKLDSSFYHKFVNTDYINQGLAGASTSVLTYSMPVIRLAELYLISAEAENEMNGPGSAYPYINAVRSRARIDKSDPAHVPDLSGLTKEQFREAVWRERKWELHQESFAWFDLKRTNTFHKVQEARGALLKVPIGSYNQTWPIPDFEINNNKIPQNPPYVN